LQKTIKVYTNDPGKKIVNLVVTGEVTAFAEIRPNRVRLSGKAGEPIQTEVTVTPKDQYPFKIVSVDAQREGNIKVDVTENNNGGKTEYLLTVANIKDVKTRYVDSVVIKTDSELRPELKINVYGNIMDPPKQPAASQP